MLHTHLHRIPLGRFNTAAQLAEITRGKSHSEHRKGPGIHGAGRRIEESPTHVVDQLHAGPGVRATKAAVGKFADLKHLDWLHRHLGNAALVPVH